MASRDRTLASRYELKYWLAPELVPVVRRMIRPFMRPDRHCVGNEGLAYTVCSLYLDSSRLDLYQSTVEAHRNRFKLRIRAYSDRPEEPVYFEVKRRADQVVSKRRGRADRRLAQEFLRGSSMPTGRLPAQVSEFVQTTRQLDARPVIRVRYRREAYEAVGCDPVRVTLDTSLVHAVTTDPNLSLNGGGWEDTPTEGVILEVKFTEACPGWVGSLVRLLGLERKSVPKYVLSVGTALGAQPPLLRTALGTAMELA